MSLLNSFRDILTVGELDRCRPTSSLEAELSAKIKDRKKTREAYSAVQRRSVGEGVNDSTPYAYAKSLAYLGNASTIRARTIDFFGWAPSLEDCQEIVDERREEFKRASSLPEQRDRERRRDIEREAARRYRQRKSEQDAA